MRKMINRKGSTLALTIIIFAVLMIFATFTLGFMVTESKQAMYHQNKIQAYYIAKSGAEVVETAIRNRLEELEDVDFTNHSNFIDLFNSPGYDTTVLVPGVETGGSEVIVHIENEDLNGNGKPVMIVRAYSEYEGIKNKVQKAIYSKFSYSTETSHKPGYGELFVSLGDEAPYEYSNKPRPVPPEYVADLTEEEKEKYITHTFPTASWTVEDSIADDFWTTAIAEVYETTNNGIYGSSGVKTDIFVNGNLELNGTVNFYGQVDIYVKGNVILKDGANIVGQKSGVPGEEEYQLNIYAYNISGYEYGLRTDGTSKALIYVGNIYVDRGNVDLNFHKDSLFDGSLIYNGDGDFEFSTTNNGNQVKLLTGSIYAPLATVKLGIDDDKVAYLIQGQVIANMIEVYANNNGKANDFYEGSTSGRIGNPIPIAISTGKIEGLTYESFYLD